MSSFDVLVVGGGNGGQGAALRTAKAGKRTALVDQGDVGGLCALRGCNPKKVMVRASEVLDEVRRASVHGITTGDVTIDWSRVVDRLHTFTDPIPGQVEDSLKKAGVTRVRGTAKFTGPDRVDVGGRELTADAIVIATGSYPRRLDIPGGELMATSDAIFDVRVPPQRMVIVGAGVVGLEFGFVFARLGTEVSIVEANDAPLGGELDADFMAPILAYAENIGVRWVWNRQVKAVRRDGAGFAVELGDRTIDCDYVLNAVGRAPNIEALDLARAGVKAGPKGITVDDYLCSPDNPRVYAAGDAHGAWQLSPVASYEGRVISRNILKPRSAKVDYTALPRAVFTTPPIASVGISEAEAKRRGIAVDAVTNDMTGWKVHAILGDELARCKTIVERATGKILGAQLCAPSAGDTIHVFALAMRAGMTSEQLHDLVYAYPTATSALASAFTRY